MKIQSKAIENGFFSDRFGSHGDDFNTLGVPSRSIPFEITDPPDGTMSYALILDDSDAIPVCGHIWTHWTAANITRTVVGENESITAGDFVQGVNSWYQGGSKVEFTGYGGMAPPDRTHVYDLHIYALNDMLNVEQGFTVEEMRAAMKGHVIESARISGAYRRYK
ncbi:MAG: YbhB/YbcL family Raf kinase inhibitor-like protein [Eubacteriaceae bacterium]|nr:YbhB/YbcL family Raf kinase inhibitor-like protein [Eubacteriaceae bacterium]